MLGYVTNNHGDPTVNSLVIFDGESHGCFLGYRILFRNHQDVEVQLSPVSFYEIRSAIFPVAQIPYCYL